MDFRTARLSEMSNGICCEHHNNNNNNDVDDVNVLGLDTIICLLQAILRKLWPIVIASIIIIVAALVAFIFLLVQTFIVLV